MWQEIEKRICEAAVVARGKRRKITQVWHGYSKHNLTLGGMHHDFCRHKIVITSIGVNKERKGL